MTITELRRKLDAESELTCALVRLIEARGRHGATSADITRVTGQNQYRHLMRAQALGALRSNPTGDRSRGRRWYTPEHFPGLI